MTPETKSWLDFAQQDFLVAQHLYGALYPKPLEIICYHCQQAAEKAIKAVMVSLGCPGGLPKRHDLSCSTSFIKRFLSATNFTMPPTP